jgi:predicted deacylase
MKRLVITAGVHGNEPSGMVALPRLAALGFPTLGPCNPWGHETGSRFTKRAVDLNRAFDRDDVVEAAYVRAVLAWADPHLVIDLHEDRQTASPYIIQSGPHDVLGEYVIDALSERYAFAQKPHLMMIRGAGGLVRPSARQADDLAARRGWSLDFWVWRRLGCTALCVEAPGGWDLERKVALHVDACLAAREGLAG